jgi:hypothetical protein
VDTESAPADMAVGTGVPVDMLAAGA